MSTYPPPYLLRCAPLLVPKVWGGTRLRQDWGKSSPEVPEDAPIGESWEVADLPQGQSCVLNGALAGAPLHEAVTCWGAELTGGNHARFPLLVKILDARKDLSVQVHPGHDDLEKMGPQAQSKDEAWVVLESQEGSVLHGFSPGVTPQALHHALAQGDPVPLLRRHHVAPGDVIHVPPGTVHAICAGTLLLEIQEPSDTTYRVFDYNRPGMDGALRSLHLEQALAVANFGSQPPLLASPTSLNVPDPGIRAHLLVSKAPYQIMRFGLSPKASYLWDARARSPSVFVVLRGSCEMEGERLEKGQTAISPAALSAVRWVAGEEGCELVAAYVS